MYEVIEFRLKAVTKVYRTMIKSLIDDYEKLAYQEEEEFVESLPTLLEIVAEKSE